MRIVAATLTALLMLPGASAQAQQVPCGSIEQMQGIARKNGEVLRVEALDYRGSVIQIWAHPETHAFSFFVIKPTGEACALGWGTSFEITDGDLKPTGDPL